MTPETELALIQAVAKTGSQVEEMHKRLFGNGQPGIIQDFDKRIDAIETDHKAFTGVVKFLKYAATIGPVMVAVVEFVIHSWAPFHQ